VCWAWGMPGIPLGQWSGSDATEQLTKTLIAFNEQSSKQTRQLMILTVVITVLTFIMTVGVGVQIWLAWPNK
jgi:hypothetical protein